MEKINKQIMQLEIKNGIFKTKEDFIADVIEELRNLKIL